MSAAVRRRACVGRSHCNTSSAFGHFCSGHVVWPDPPHGPLPALRDTASEQEGDGPWWGGHAAEKASLGRCGSRGVLQDWSAQRTVQGTSSQSPCHGDSAVLGIPPHGEISLAPTPVLAIAHHSPPPSPNSQPHPTPHFHQTPVPERPP